MKDETKIWLKYSRENLRSAGLLLESGLFNPCLQNIQQAVEKGLKAVGVRIFWSNDPFWCSWGTGKGIAIIPLLLLRPMIGPIGFQIAARSE